LQSSHPGFSLERGELSRTSERQTLRTVIDPMPMVVVPNPKNPLVLLIPGIPQRTHLREMIPLVNQALDGPHRRQLLGHHI
jgi:hypothetical protein